MPPRPRSPGYPRSPHDLRTFLTLFGASFLVALALYAGALGNPFVSDDKEIVAGNMTLNGTSLRTVGGIFTSDYWTEVAPDGRKHPMAADHNLYRPVTHLSFWLSARLGGVTPESMRLGNLLLHALAAALVGCLAVESAGLLPGLLASLLVTVHPVATDVLNRIVGRSDILVLAGTALFLVLMRRARSKGWTWGSAAIAFLVVVLTLGAKESGLMMLPVAAAFACVLEGRKGMGAAAKADRTLSPGITGFLVLGAGAAVYLVARFLVVGAPHYVRDVRLELIQNPLAGVPLGARLPSVLALAFYYVRMLLVPWPLMVLDIPAHLPGWGDPEVWAGVVVLAGILVAAVVLGRKRHPLFVPAVWWLSGFFIVSQFLVPIGAYREVRFVYPLLGAFGLFAGWVWAHVTDGTGVPAVSRKRLAGSAAVLLLAVAAVLVVRRNGDFRSETTLYEADARHGPDRPAPQVILGTLYLAEGRNADAERAKRKAVDLAPWSSQAWCDLGGYYAFTGNTAKAEEALQKSLEASSQNGEAYMNLATIRLREKKLDEALDLLKKAEKLSPASSLVQLNLALVESMKGDKAGALARLRELQRRDPENTNIPVLTREIQQGG